MEKYKSVIKNYIYNPEKFILDQRFRDKYAKNNKTNLYKPELYTVIH